MLCDNLLKYMKYFTIVLLSTNTGDDQMAGPSSYCRAHILEVRDTAPTIVDCFAVGDWR